MMSLLHTVTHRVGIINERLPHELSGTIILISRDLAVSVPPLPSPSLLYVTGGGKDRWPTRAGKNVVGKSTSAWKVMKRVSKEGFSVNRVSISEIWEFEIVHTCVLIHIRRSHQYRLVHRP